MTSTAQKLKGYFVLFKPENNTTTSTPDDSTPSLLESLCKMGLVNLENTRAFNTMTNGVHKKSTTEVSQRVRNAREEQKRRRQEYAERESTREHVREYNQKPEVKKKKKESAKRRAEIRKKMLESIPEWKKFEIMKEMQHNVEPQEVGSTEKGE